MWVTTNRESIFPPEFETSQLIMCWPEAHFSAPTITVNRWLDFWLAGEVSASILLDLGGIILFLEKNELNWDFDSSVFVKLRDWGEVILNQRKKKVCISGRAWRLSIDMKLASFRGVEKLSSTVGKKFAIGCREKLRPGCQVLKAPSVDGCCCWFSDSLWKEGKGYSDVPIKGPDM